MLGWWRERKRERLRAAPFPEDWEAVLQEAVPHYSLLSPAEQEVLRGDVRVFLAEKYWEGCAGLVLTDEMRVTIAGQACLLTLCLAERYYPNVRSIFVYPASYRVREEHRGPAGVVTVRRSRRLGEAWQDGPVVLSWADVKSGGVDERDGTNVVFHEFAHTLDMLDGASDGTPRLYSDAEYRRWYEVMKAEWDALVEAAADGRPTLLDHYGATNAAELFAVATEAFFEKPRQMLRRHPALYDVLRDYYRQDPAGRFPEPEWEPPPAD
jgi:Mlc titration factor MtfA (ptsG expression regulator)